MKAEGGQEPALDHIWAKEQQNQEMNPGSLLGTQALEGSMTAPCTISLGTMDNMQHVPRTAPASAPFSFYLQHDSKEQSHWARTLTLRE